MPPRTRHPTQTWGPSVGQRLPKPQPHAPLARPLLRPSLLPQRSPGAPASRRRHHGVGTMGCMPRRPDALPHPSLLPQHRSGALTSRCSSGGWATLRSRTGAPGGCRAGGVADHDEEGEQAGGRLRQLFARGGWLGRMLGGTLAPYCLRSTQLAHRSVGNLHCSRLFVRPLHAPFILACARTPTPHPQCSVENLNFSCLLAQLCVSLLCGFTPCTHPHPMMCCAGSRTCTSPTSSSCAPP